ncbi:MAG: hypothetical protein QT11_C0001G0787 [archaeon GW2011_AR20]|nr:MAG: hypothetical protein QT11_C0001G0787 [archaeon GW2011_AR20]MBS3160801.1 hypothetical protein [Candidatus Woesearchaeota archaeon]
MAEINPADYILIKDRDSNLYSAKNRVLYKHDWEEQIRKLAERKGDMCEIRDFLDLRDLLDSRKKTYDGKGSLVSTLEKQGLLDEMIDRRTPWRAEYFGNRFFKYDEKWYMESGFKVINDKISPTSIKEIKPLMMGGWTSFKHINEDGLVTKLRGKEIFYFSPIDGRVARFVAGSDWAYLNCRGSPFYSNGGLGVRESRKNFEV